MASRGFNNDIGIHGGDGIRIITLKDVIGANGPGDFQGLVVHVDSDDPGRTGTLENGDHKRTNRAAADHKRGLSLDVSCASYRVPGNTGRFNQAAVRRSRFSGSGRSIRVGRLA